MIVYEIDFHTSFSGIHFQETNFEKYTYKGAIYELRGVRRHICIFFIVYLKKIKFLKNLYENPLHIQSF